MTLRRTSAARSRYSPIPVIVIACVLSPVGCSSSQSSPPALIERIDGVRAIEYDGLDLTIRKDDSGPAAGWILLGPQGEGETAVLRLGKAFQLTDGDSFIRTYRAAALDEELITFQERTQINRYEQGESLRESTRMVQVRPYGVIEAD